MSERSTDALLRDHLAARQRDDLEHDLAANYATDCVLLTSYGVFQGHDGVRKASRLLRQQIGPARFEFRTTLVHGEIGFLEWQAHTGRGRIEDGADSYLVRAGRIQVMTIHYTVQNPRE